MNLAAWNARIRSSPAARFVATWVLLILLLVLTISSSFVSLRGWNTAINLLIAALKAALVAWIFMRLRASVPLVRLIAAAALVWTAILLGLSLTDLLTRGPP
jgi:cytochrome c oxidase subunit 4